MANDRPAGTEGARPGEVLASRPVLIAAGEGTALQLVEVQPENKRRMPAQDWAAGRRIAPGRVLDPERHG